MNPSKIQKTDNPMPSKKAGTEPQNMILRRKLKVKESTEGSTVHDDDFNKGPWLSMLQHLSLPPFVDKHSSDVKLLRYPISYVVSEGFRDKVPLMVVSFKKFTATETDASVIVKDPTGTVILSNQTYQSGDMEGTVHKQVLESYPDIGTGSVVVLRKVSVFNPTPFSHYLNITKQNIICIFPASTPAPSNSVHLNDPKCIYYNEKEAKAKVHASQRHVVQASQKQTTQQQQQQKQQSQPSQKQQKSTQQKQAEVFEEESVEESSLIEEQLALEEELLLQNKDDDDPFW